MQNLKIGIFGVGAIGSVVSLKLDASHNKYYYNRSQKTEIVVVHQEEVYQEKITLSNSDAPIDLDWLLICLKEYQLAGAEKALSSLIKQNTKVAVIRNGIRLKEPILKYTRSENILECMIDCPTQLTASNHYHQLRKPKILVAQNQLSADFKKLFDPTKIEILQVDDYTTTNWEKLIESSALGAILCLSGESCWIFKDENVRELFQKIVKEAIEVARAEGANIREGFMLELLEKVKHYPASKESSMLIDRRMGRTIEINAKNGVISSLGKKHQIKTELNDLITTLLKHTNQQRD
ncbi:hypothetical protein BKI52_03495 [marine bacterium AO1-C]|nr:hypothetical protein BKI52_03495 [marine bacterium AO1-C]